MPATMAMPIGVAPVVTAMAAPTAAQLPARTASAFDSGDIRPT